MYVSYTYIHCLAEGYENVVHVFPLKKALRQRARHFHYSEYYLCMRVLENKQRKNENSDDFFSI